jgi:Flp pilus assembly protein CpaB
VGQISVLPIAVGEPILASKLNDPKSPIFVVIPPTALDANGNITPQTPNFRALSITVQDANAVGGVLAVGDLVDVVFTMQIDPARYIQNPRQTLVADFNAKIILERVPILARTASVYTIRADAITAETLTWLQVSGGQLHLYLRAPRDERASGSQGTTFQDMYDRFRPALNDKIQAPAP